MSAVADNIQVNMGSVREAVAASLNRSAEPPVELQPQAPAPVPEPVVPVAAEPAPAEPVEAQQTDLPVQAVEEDFELDLSKNPLDESAPQETAVEPPASRKQWEEGFQDFIKSNPRGQKIWANHAEMARVSAPAEEGGIGFRPDADQIKQWHSAHTTMDRMMMDFTSGDPNTVKNFVDFWFGKDQQGRALDGVGQIAEKLPSLLAESNPEVYQKIGTHYGSALIHQLSSLAASGQHSEADAARLADAALVLGAITGIQAGAAAQPAPAKETDELAAARARIRELESGRVSQSQSQIKQTVFRSLDTVLERDAESALAPLKQTYKDEPLVFNALKAQMVHEMRQVASTNPAIGAEINNAMTRMIRSGSTDQLDGVIRLWRKGYSDHIPSARSKYLKAAGVALTSKADESRTILQQASVKTAPNPGSAPGQSIRNPERQPGEPMQDFVRRLITSRVNPQ